MAAGSTRIFLNDGEVISIYTDATPVGMPVRVSMTGAAGTASPQYFQVRNRASIDDILTVTTTAGTLEIFADGIATGKTIMIDQRWVVANNRKQYILPITFRPGVRYQLIPRIATS